ncbi:MAG: hypothetical protein IMF16_01300, partial [Proteobacteria bacterium]|nr:hypothetical protein [Pseudomonadota bacterium]
MTELVGEKRLGWAFAIALVLHVAALAVAARIPAQSAAGGGLEGIRVFDAAAPMVISPVELVQWSPEVTPEETVTLASPAPEPPEPVRIRPVVVERETPAPQPAPIRTIRPTPQVPEALPVTPRPISPPPVTNEDA